MNYKLSYKICKELKDAGFPQTGKSREHWGIGYSGGKKKESVFCSTMTGTKDEAYIPTLSELIEECGNEFFSLCNWGTYWKSRYKRGNFSSEVKAKTPKEAVAKLWLELNDK